VAGRQRPWPLTHNYELPPIGWKRFKLGSSQNDSAAFPSLLVTYASYLLARPLSCSALTGVANREPGPSTGPPVRLSVRGGPRAHLLVLRLAGAHGDCGADVPGLYAESPPSACLGQEGLHFTSSTAMPKVLSISQKLGRSARRCSPCWVSSASSITSWLSK
jgi:hypothetical protein